MGTLYEGIWSLVLSVLWVVLMCGWCYLVTDKVYEYTANPIGKLYCVTCLSWLLIDTMVHDPMVSYVCLRSQLCIYAVCENQWCSLVMAQLCIQQGSADVSLLPVMVPLHYSMTGSSCLIQETPFTVSQFALEVTTELCIFWRPCPCCPGDHHDTNNIYWFSLCKQEQYIDMVLNLELSCWLNCSILMLPLWWIYVRWMPGLVVRHLIASIWYTQCLSLQGVVMVAESGVSGVKVCMLRVVSICTISGMYVIDCMNGLVCAIRDGLSMSYCLDNSVPRKWLLKRTVNDSIHLYDLYVLLFGEGMLTLQLILCKHKGSSMVSIVVSIGSPTVLLSPEECAVGPAWWVYGPWEDVLAPFENVSALVGVYVGVVLRIIPDHESIVLYYINTGGCV